MGAATATWKDLRAKHILSALLDRPSDETDDEDNPEYDVGAGTAHSDPPPPPSPPPQGKPVCYMLDVRLLLMVKPLCCRLVVHVSLVTFPGTTRHGTNSLVMVKGGWGDLLESNRNRGLAKHM